MQVRYSVLLIALLALGWSGVASAEDSEANVLEPKTLSEVSTLSLDNAFERATSPKHDRSLHGLAGPSTMNCENGAELDGPETCVVTAEGMLASVPAALAQH
jgi:hypothetical protein